MKREHKGQSLLLAAYNFVVVDIETTGLSPEKNNIIEIGCVKYESGLVSDTFQMLVKPPKLENKETYISKSIESITGICDDMVKDKPSIYEVYPQFRKFIGNSILVGHNVNFDINFLYEASMKVLGVPLTNDFVDTLRLSRMFQTDLDHHSLSDVCRSFSVVNTQAHRALSDCYATGKCYIMLRRFLEY